MSFAVTIVSILNNLLLGAAGNALYDGIKVGLKRTSKKGFEELYFDAFEKAVHEVRPSLVKYAKEDGEIGIDKKAFNRFLLKQINISKSNISEINNQDVFRQIRDVFVEESVFFIGGHTLESDEFRTIIETLINRARSILRGEIIAHEGVFKECILANVESANQSLADINIVITELDQSISSNFLDLEHLLIQIVKKTDEVIQFFKSLQTFDVLDVHNMGVETTHEGSYGFYEGYKARWSDLLRGLDIIRDQFDDTLKLVSEFTGVRVLIVIRSTMGSGKTTFLKRLAITLAQQENVVLYPKVVPKSLSITSDFQNIKEIYDKTRKSDKGLFICLDDATRIADFDQLLEYIAEMNIKATILVASRNDEWLQNRPLLTANMEHETVEIELVNHWSEAEAQELKNRLQSAGKLAKAVNFVNGSVFETMWEATAGEPLRERIHARIAWIENDNQPELIRAYEYSALLSQYGLVIPVLLIQKLSNQETSTFDIVSRMLLKEIAEYSDDIDAITVGHEQFAHEVVQQRYQNAYGQRRLISDLVNIVKSCAAPHRNTVLELLPRIIEDDKAKGDLIIGQCKEHLLILRKASTPDELSKNWATLYQMIGDSESAEKCHLESIHLDENAFSLGRFAWFLKSQYRFHEAINYLNRAIEIDKDNIGSYSMLGRVLKSMLLYERAGECFEIALNASPKLYRPSLFPHYLPILIYLKRYDEAEKVCRELINLQLEKQESPLRFLIVLIKLLLIKQDLNSVEIEIRNFLTYSPTLNKSRLKAIIHSLPISKTRRDELDEWLNKFNQDDFVAIKPATSESLISTEKFVLEESSFVIKSSSPHSDGLAQKQKPSDENDILPHLNKLLIKNKHDSTAYLKIAKYYLQRQEVAEAEKYFLAAVVNRNPVDFTGPLHYSHFLVTHDRPIEAINYFRHAVSIAIDSSSRKRFSRTGTAGLIISDLLSRGFVLEVMECWHLVEDAFPQFILSEEIQERFLARNYVKEFQFLCEMQLRIQSKAISRVYTPALVVALIRQGNFDDAKKYIKQFQNIVPFNKYELVAIQTCARYLTRQRHSSVDRFIDLALRDDPNNSTSLIIKSEYLMQKRQYPKAQNMLYRVLKNSSTSGESYALLGQISSLEGNTLDAYNLFIKAVELQPENVEASARFAFFLREEGKFFELIDSNTYQKYLEIAEKHARFAYENAQSDSYVTNIYTGTLLRLGKLSLADQVAQQILQLIPNDIYVLTRAAQVKAALSNFDKAIEYFEKAVEIAPRDFKAHCLGLYGRALLAHGNFKNAYDKLAEALKYSPFGFRTQLDMANYYSVRKSYDFALRYYTQALEKHPNSFELHIGVARLYEILGEDLKAVKELATCGLQSWRTRNITSTICSSYSAFLYQQKEGGHIYKEILFLCGMLAYHGSLSLPLTLELANRIYKEITETNLSGASSDQIITYLKSIMRDRREIPERELLMALESVIKAI